MTTTIKICVLCACTICCTGCKSTDKLTHADNDLNISTFTTWGSLSRYDLHLFDTIDVWPLGAGSDTATQQWQPYRAIRHTRLDAVINHADTIKDTSSIQQTQQVQTTTATQKRKFHNSQYKFFYIAVFIVVLFVFTIRFKR